MGQLIWICSKSSPLSLLSFLGSWQWYKTKFIQSWAWHTLTFAPVLVSQAIVSLSSKLELPILSYITWGYEYTFHSVKIKCQFFLLKIGEFTENFFKKGPFGKFQNPKSQSSKTAPMNTIQIALLWYQMR